MIHYLKKPRPLDLRSITMNENKITLSFIPHEGFSLFPVENIIYAIDYTNEDKIDKYCIGYYDHDSNSIVMDALKSILYVHHELMYRTIGNVDCKDIPMKGNIIIPEEYQIFVKS